MLVHCYAPHEDLASCSEGGFFKGVLTFPSDYPNNPPEFRFTSEMWHPNGACILIMCTVSPSCTMAGRAVPPLGCAVCAMCYTVSLHVLALVDQHGACSAPSRCRLRRLQPGCGHMHESVKHRPDHVLCLAVYPDGRVCISILHAPGDDPHGYEQAAERWQPIHTVRMCFKYA